MRIEHVLEIDAPAETVWQVIVDLDRYPEWNRFVVSCRSTLEVGSPIEMRVRVLPFLAQPQRETVFEHVPGRRLCYGVPRHPSGALESRRCHEIESLGPTRTRYTSRFQLSGWLAPVVQLLLGARLAQGFDAMSRGIGRRAISCVRSDECEQSGAYRTSFLGTEGEAHRTKDTDRHAHDSTAMRRSGWH